MHLCVKGRYGYEFIHSPKRIMKPRLRKYLLDGSPRPSDRGAWVEVEWDTALDITARRLREIQDRYGPQKIGLLSSGLYLNEENYLMNKMARQILKTNNIDICAHLYHPSPTAGIEDALNRYASSNSLEDTVNKARSILVIGSNTTEEHPVFGAKIRQAVLRRGCKLIVAHPDFINMSEYAALRLVHRYGSDSILVNGLIHIILEKGLEDRSFIEKHTQGFEGFQDTIRSFTAEYTSQMTGIEVETLYKAAQILAEQRPTAIIWGVDLVRAEGGSSHPASLANLQMVLGNLGIAGGGLIPLRTQSNSQGACDMGALPGMYSGYQAVDDPYDPQETGSSLGSRPAGPGRDERRGDDFRCRTGGAESALYFRGGSCVLGSGERTSPTRT